MGVKFTPQQQEVIDLRGSNILVSAAAGSGKTAVLTERIAGIVCDGEHPVDIDRLLVVTFTNAAAAEMRERIGKRLSEKLSGDPENEHLQRQCTLLHNAQITTIDSFCLYLVKNHFNEIGLDPAFRVADEREIKLLQKEAMEEILEEAFEKGGEGFHRCVESLCPGGKERVLEEQILELYRYALSFPWPEMWLEERRGDYRYETPEEFRNSGIVRYLNGYVKSTLEGCREKLKTALDIAHLPGGPKLYEDILKKELEQAERLCAGEDYFAIGALLQGIVFERLPGKKDPSVDPSLRDRAKDLRSRAKEDVTDLIDKFYGMDVSGILDMAADCCQVMDELIDLVHCFDRRVREKKLEKKIIEFSDMEHYALDILWDRDGEECRPSRVAEQYRGYYYEILVDEYQDSNQVQEELLRAICGEKDGRYNRFMVGDVKQSIYRFRLARPELFLEKYHTYTDEGVCRRIDLSKNFRSRNTVIDTVNSVFSRIMSRKVGKIAYDEKAALYIGAAYPDNPGSESELLVLGKAQKERKEQTFQKEAKVVAGRIRELLRDGCVTDQETGSLRKVCYRDIVILLRALGDLADTFKEVLEGEGIPVYVDSKSGYFSAVEVQNLLSYLRVIDNPLQDIPLYCVLKSPFVGMTEEQIALLRGNHREMSLYDALKQSEDPAARNFLERLRDYREKMVYLPVRALLEVMIGDHDYLNYVTALPGGSRRRGNVEMLLVKASDYEKTSYFGLFHFLRYMEQLEKYDEDYGEADTLDENADVVHIMTIHKSKGLEFPVVFVSGMGKEFNLMDTRKAMLLDMDCGIGMDHVDLNRRVKTKMLQKNVVAKKMLDDTLSEEIRLLYVAMTRAREKLILTGALADPEKKLPTAENDLGEEEQLSFSDFLKAKNYLDFLLPILKKTDLQVRMVDQCEILGEEMTDRIEMHSRMEELTNSDRFADPAMVGKLLQRFAYQYPHSRLEGLYTKTTVSELKHARMAEKDQAAHDAFEKRETELYVPQFRREREEVTGAVRGNAYHRAMELLDFGELLGVQFGAVPDTFEVYSTGLDTGRLERDVAEFLRAMAECGKLAREYFPVISPGKLVSFLKAEIGWRMWRADSRGCLYREQPFVLAIPATRLKEEYPGEEKVLIQGIIDVFFREGDGFVLLDYKTDSVDSTRALWNRYETQLDYYAEAIERLQNAPVKERILYSFHLDKM